MLDPRTHRSYAALPTCKDSQYRLETDFNEKRQFQGQDPGRSKKSSSTFMLILVAALASSLTFLAAFSLFGVTEPLNPRWKSCGNDTTTALTRNCSFDLISFAWQTPECYDTEIVSDFAAWDDWEWYTEPYNRTVIPKSAVLEGNRTLYVSWDYHVTHCTFMWRQMHRAYERGWIDSHLRAYAHTLHCQDVLLGRTEVPVERRITMAKVIYPTCERVSSGFNGWNRGEEKLE